MTEREFEMWLREGIAELDELREDEDEEDEPVVDTVGSFKEEGILTSNRGLVVRMLDGSEFQVTIVRSK